jgi:hypothetical protein
MNYEIQHARKVITWASPIVLLAIALWVWAIFAELIPTLRHIVNDGPVIRIYAGSPAVPLLVIASVVSIVMAVLKAIPVQVAVFKKAVRWTVISWIGTTVVLLLSVLLARPVQQSSFPKNGYTECDQLHGNPTIWFTDWVKNPAWCVKGKRREWVFEQARIADQRDAPSTETKK